MHVTVWAEWTPWSSYRACPRFLGWQILEPLTKWISLAKLVWKFLQSWGL